MTVLSKISPCIWFDGQAEAAAEHYTSIFGGSILRRLAYSEVGPGEPGTTMLVDFELEGIQFTALNGGPIFTPDEAISFQVICEDQAEVDRYWDALADGGEAQPCGWLKDRFGVSWQVVPEELNRLVADPDRERARRAMEAMLQVHGKFDIEQLRRAADAVPTSSEA